MIKLVALAGSEGGESTLGGEKGGVEKREELEEGLLDGCLLRCHLACRLVQVMVVLRQLADKSLPAPCIYLTKF